MAGPVLNAMTNNSRYVAVVLAISPNGQVTGGCLIGAGASQADLHLSVPAPQPASTGTRTIRGGLLVGTCRGLFSLHQQGPIIVGAASRFELKADAGIDGNDPHAIALAFSDTPSWSLEITADGLLQAEPTQ